MTDTLQSQTGGDLKETAQQKAQDVAGQATGRARDAAGRATEGLRTQIDTRTTAAGEGIVGLADIARQAGDQMREKGQEGPAQYADRAAQYVERLGGYLRDADATRMLQDVESVARRAPVPLAAGGLILGFLGARFLRASSQGRSGVDQTYRGEYVPTAEVPSGFAEADRSFREVTDRPGTLDTGYSVGVGGTTGGTYVDTDLTTTSGLGTAAGLDDDLARRDPYIDPEVRP
jgi:hypothetical protein